MQLIHGGIKARKKKAHEEQGHVHNSLCLNMDTLIELKNSLEDHFLQLVESMPEQEVKGTDWYDEKYDIVIMLDGEDFSLGLDPDMYKGFMKFVKEQLVERM